jgi:cytochrome c peroxidase
MNLNIKLFLLFVVFTPKIFAGTGVETIVKKAIISNGYLSPEELYTNPNENLASEGKVFFNSEHLSLNGSISCATCHISNKASTDGIPNAAGINGSGEGLKRLLSGAEIVPRNTLALWGVGSKGFKTFFWDGRVDFSFDKPISQFGSSVPSSDPLITAVHLPVVEIRETVEEDDFIEAHKQESVAGAEAVYRAVTNKLIKNEPKAIKDLASKINKKIDEITFLDIATSIAAFIRKEFKIKTTLLDDFVKGEKELSEEQILGATLFYGKAGCVSCHGGPHFTDQKFYTVPFPQLGFGKNGFGIDYGRYNATFNPEDLYKFRTPSLYNIEKTSPYSHSGSVMTLEKSIKMHFDPLSAIDISNYSQLQRHELYKYLAKSDTPNKVNFLSKKEVLSLVEFLRLLSFD